MFCPKCGSTVNDGLKYCNSCGERLGRDDVGDDGPGKMLNNVLMAVFFVVLFGFGILAGIIALLLNGHQQPEMITLITIAYLIAIFGITFSLVRQVPKLIDAKLKGWSGTSKIRSQPQLSAPTTAQLNEYREPVMSVTDHTTKTLDKVPFREI